MPVQSRIVMRHDNRFVRVLGSFLADAVQWWMNLTGGRDKQLEALRRH